MKKLKKNKTTKKREGGNVSDSEKAAFLNEKWSEVHSAMEGETGDEGVKLLQRGDTEEEGQEVHEMEETKGGKAEIAEVGGL